MNLKKQAREAHDAQVSHLFDKLTQATEGAEHLLMLNALLAFYICVAEAHSCCTETAARACQLAAERLKDAAMHRPQGIPLH